MHIIMSSNRVLQHVIAFTEKDDNPKAEWGKGITQSLVTSCRDSRTKTETVDLIQVYVFMLINVASIMLQNLLVKLVQMPDGK